VDIILYALFMLVVLFGMFISIADKCKTYAMKRMRRKGATYKEIGERFGFSPSGARHRVLKM